MIIQGTDEWFAARLGKVTASRISDVLAKTKTGVSAARTNYAAQLIAERLTGAPAESFSSPAMRWGTETEPLARMAYEFYQDIEVIQIGFADHPTIGMSGASPDGLVGDRGLVEIKCPNTGTHIDTLLMGTIDSKYMCQMQWQMACTGREWCDFVSYDPRLPETMRLHIDRVERSDSAIEAIEKEVVVFLNEIGGKVDDLRRLYEPEELSILAAG